MPGPAHSGVAYVEVWRPGTGTAGQVQTTEIGGFSADMLLMGVYLDTGGSPSVSGDARLTVTIQQAASAGMYNVLQSVPDDCVVLTAEYGNLYELGVVLPAGAKMRVTLQHSAGGDNVPLVFLWAVP